MCEVLSLSIDSRVSGFHSESMQLQRAELKSLLLFFCLFNLFYREVDFFSL